jgi:hypothetical protein
MASLYDISKAARWDIFIEQGATFEEVLNFGDVPLTGFSFRGQVRRTHSDPEVLAEFEFTDLGDNRLLVRIAPTVSAGIPHGKWVYDIEAFTANDVDVKRLYKGRATVDPEATRSV